MKVRLVLGPNHSGDPVWRVESRHWFWPFWEMEDYFSDYEKAKALALLLANPVIERIS